MGCNVKCCHNKDPFQFRIRWGLFATKYLFSRILVTILFFQESYNGITFNNDASLPWIDPFGDYEEEEEERNTRKKSGEIKNLYEIGEIEKAERCSNPALGKFFQQIIPKYEEGNNKHPLFLLYSILQKGIQCESNLFKKPY